jgi:8-oxo-dGTP pyrophosphatase MutT (NUDIX family)
MNFEPKNVFVGLIDFFSILLPGAVLTYILKEDMQGLFLRSSTTQFSDVEGWAVFLFSSYLLGHFISLLGSKIDDVYDYLRNAIDANQIEKLAKAEPISWPPARWVANLIFGREDNRALNLAVRIKEYYLKQLYDTKAVNTFQWGKARLALEAPEAAASAQRFEADSKFFRSLFVVLIILLLWGLGKWPPLTFGILIFMTAGAFYRYAEQRLKSTNQVYWYVITQESTQGNGFRQTAPVREDGVTHAGGVVFRRSKKEVEYLVVQARKDPKTWVLPKGHIEPGETLHETAAREVLEETGVLAGVVADLGKSSYVDGETPVTVQYYLMEEAGKGRPRDRNRKARWRSYDEALTMLAHPESCEQLALANEKLGVGIPLLS